MFYRSYILNRSNRSHRIDLDFKNNLNTYAKKIFNYFLLSALILSTSLMITQEVWADHVELKTQLNQTAILSDQKQTVYLKVALKGLKPPKVEERTPLNVALVIDRSGSMRGDRIKRAKEAARLVVKMLNKDDILSIIAYDTRAEVLIPATKISQKEQILKGINRITVNGSTALYAGVTLGANEVSKFFDAHRVNRVVLLSDGIANVGPSSPSELASLGQALGRKGIAVSTIGLGLGYNEDLMSQLAASSDGNHSFVERSNQLSSIMEMEFEDALSVIAQDVEIKVTFADGVRPVRTLGRDAEFKGQEVSTKLNQLVGGHEKYILIEAEVSSTKVGLNLNIADVIIHYQDTITHTKASLNAHAKVRSVKTPQEVRASEVSGVMEDVVQLIATEKKKIAVSLRDKGDLNGAYKMMRESSSYLKSNAKRYKSKKLEAMTIEAEEESTVIRKKGKDWKRLRKSMKRKAHKADMQQSF